MKSRFSYLFCFLLIAVSACSQKKATGNPATSGKFDAFIPREPISWISDFENMFSLSENQYFDSILAHHNEKTSNEIALVTLSLDTNIIRITEDFDQFSLELFSNWGVGQIDKNNGVGILISMNLRKIRIEVGLGLESKLTNDEAKHIIDSIFVPAFKKGDYFSGVSKGLDAIIREIE